MKQNLSIIGDPLLGKSDNNYRKPVNDDESSQHYNDGEYLGSIGSKIDQITKGQKPYVKRILSDILVANAKNEAVVQSHLDSIQSRMFLI